MNFDYSEEQQLLADSVRRLLAKDYDFEARKKIVASSEGYSSQVWSKFAEMGLTALPLSPDYGGFGGGAVDLMGGMEGVGGGVGGGRRGAGNRAARADVARRAARREGRLGRAQASDPAGGRRGKNEAR